MDLAKEAGCGYMYLMATGIYSQKIFRDLEFEMLHEVEYKTYKVSISRNSFSAGKKSSDQFLGGHFLSEIYSARKCVLFVLFVMPLCSDFIVGQFNLQQFFWTKISDYVVI
jgi:hypothetical protein